MKVVINNCYGGFSLSESGIARYLELSNLEMTANFYDRDIPRDDAALIQVVQSGIARYLELKGIEWPNAGFYDRDIPRDDAALIQVVQELGDAANGSCADLKIVEVPDEVDWYVEEYDGNEWVAEKHRTWS